MDNVKTHIEKEAKRFSWVMDIVKECGMTYLTWLELDYGNKFACNCGIPERDICHQFVLCNRGRDFENTEDNRQWLRDILNKIVGNNE